MLPLPPALRSAEFRLRRLYTRSPWLPWLLPQLLVLTYSALHRMLLWYVTAVVGAGWCCPTTLAVSCALGSALVHPLYRYVVPVPVLLAVQAYLLSLVHYTMACVLPRPLGPVPQRY